MEMATARQTARAARRDDGEVDILSLEGEGFTVRRLTPYHFRINEMLDLYPVAKRWHLLTRNKRGGWGHESARQIVVRLLGVRT